MLLSPRPMTDGMDEWMDDRTYDTTVDGRTVDVLRANGVPCRGFRRQRSNVLLEGDGGLENGVPPV